MLKKLFWETLYSRWRSRPGERTAGYSLLLPVPSDLPVFLKIALAVAARQDATGRVETLVIPDRPSPQFDRLFEELARDASLGPLRLVNMGWLDRLITGRLNNPTFNHWLQLVNGIESARSTHALLHDADAFILEPSFMRRQYETCAQRGLACYGVSEVWDKWFAENGYDHLTATWELMFEIDWARSFPPYEHRGHDAVIEGKPHTFDTTLLPQCRTPVHRIGKASDAPSQTAPTMAAGDVTGPASLVKATPPSAESGFVHFNYVISTYRKLQQSPGPYEDENLRILLIRLLIDIFDEAGGPYAVPAMDELVRGLEDPKSMVTYRAPATRTNYPLFRNKLDELWTSPLFDARQRQKFAERIDRFDRALLDR